MATLPSSPRNTSAAGRAASPDLPPAAKAGAASPAPPGPRGPGLVRPDRRTREVLVGAAVLLLTVAWMGTGYHYDQYVDSPAALTGDTPTDARKLAQLETRLTRNARDLGSRLKATAPRGVYIVIDQTQNRIYLKRDEDTLLEAVCSTGSGMVLKETGGKKREWVFDSPRGRFEVQIMMINPVWSKPDWAFVEESQPIPKNPSERLEYGSLGEYALYFGDGFMIHGTLYERLLGRAVSHGCIRVGRDDLRKVWANARVGTHIYIY